MAFGFRRKVKPPLEYPERRKEGEAAGKENRQRRCTEKISLSLSLSLFIWSLPVEGQSGAKRLLLEPCREVGISFVDSRTIARPSQKPTWSSNQSENETKER